MMTENLADKETANTDRYAYSIHSAKSLTTLLLEDFKRKSFSPKVNSDSGKENRRLTP